MISESTPVLNVQIITARLSFVHINSRSHAEKNLTEASTMRFLNAVRPPSGYDYPFEIPVKISKSSSAMRNVDHAE